MLTKLPLILLCLTCVLHSAEKPILLWPDGAPGALGNAAKDQPTLTPYQPAKPSGAAMLLIPGGSYSGIYEGQAEPFALWLNEQGLTVFVLRYRLGSAGYRYPAQLQDAVEAMFQIRADAAKWKIDPHRIGVMGFSAGGHLASTLINRPEDGMVPGCNRSVSSRPDLAVLCYPVISMITKPHAMLDLGRQTLVRAGLPNVTLVAGDMTSLSDFADASADAVILTMSLHHLPDTNALHRCLAETRRILKPGGGLYLADFGRLKREASQRFCAHEREAEQPSLCTLDYYNSLRAAFSTSEIRQAASVFDEGVRLHKTFLVPFLLALRSRPLAPPGAVTRFAAQAIYNALDARQQYDFPSRPASAGDSTLLPTRSTKITPSSAITEREESSTRPR